MLIAIDGNEANIVQRVGIGEYAYQVIKHIYEARKEKIEFTIYLKEKPTKDLPPKTPWWKYKVFGPKKLWTQFALPFHLFSERKKPDLFFSPTHYAPRFVNCPLIISIMDLSYVRYPEMFRKKDLWQLRSWTDYSVKRANKILTISHFSKKEIINYYKLPKDKVVVTYPGYNKDNFKFQISNIKLKKREIQDKYRITGDYILFVGTLQPRKNIVGLIQAFQRVEGDRRKEIKLMIVGKKGWLYEEIFDKVRKLKLEKRIIFTDFVKSEDLPVLYQSARCFVLPSLYEGFGIPVVEAMACGCPVVISNVSSLPEIAGEAGILVDPKNIDEIAQGINRACFDEKKRSEMVKKGLERAKFFSWETCAKQTLAVFKQVKS